MCIKDEEEEKPLIFVSADIVIAVDRRGKERLKNSSNLSSASQMKIFINFSK
jgi:hypothetical protein